MEANCFIGDYLPKPPNPRWIVYVRDASHTDQPTANAYIPPENVRSLFFKLYALVF